MPEEQRDLRSHRASVTSEPVNEKHIRVMVKCNACEGATFLLRSVHLRTLTVGLMTICEALQIPLPVKASDETKLSQVEVDASSRAQHSICEVIEKKERRN